MTQKRYTLSASSAASSAEKRFMVEEARMGSMLAECAQDIVDAYTKLSKALGPEEALVFAAKMLMDVKPEVAPDAAMAEVLCLIADA